MSKVLIYSCVFFSDKYIDLLHLLLKSYKLFGNENNNVEYLVICNQSFENKIMNIFDELNIKGKIWCLNLQTKFEAGYSRLKIFDYPHIQEYTKILYLDCDILVTNSLNSILDIPLENKLYGLREGRTNHPFWGGQFFNGEKNIDAFTSGILLFNNHNFIKNLFSQILDHIHKHISNGLEIPICLDQPFIVYHAIKNNIYNNSKLIGIVVNNPKQHKKETISHFPGEPGHYQSKIKKMTEFMQNIMFKVNKNESFTKVDPNTFKSILHANKGKFDNLYEICKKIGEPVEGNCFTQHMNIDKVIPDLVYKQLNHFSLGQVSNDIMEIGFNAGHSSLLYLLANPNSKLTIFDICEHKYTMPCFNYLQSLFPNRLTIYPGDSTKTIPQFFKDNTNRKFDLIHIDGAHFGDIPNKDFYNSLKLAGDVMIWDDTQIPTLNNLFNSYIQKGLIYEIRLYDTKIYKHRICRVNHLLNRDCQWGHSKIRFLENGQMDAFGKGKYYFIDKHLVKCNFGGREHLLKFNPEYLDYISIRRDDFEVITNKK